MSVDDHQRARVPCRASQGGWSRVRACRAGLGVVMSIVACVVASQALAACADNPGTCTVNECFSLQADVNDTCSTGDPRACTAADSCAQLSAKKENRRQCLQARTRINNRCFLGGDLGHNIAVMQEVVGIIDCDRLLFQNGCTDPCD